LRCSRHHRRRREHAERGAPAHYRAWPSVRQIGSSDPASGLSLAGPSTDTYVVLRPRGPRFLETEEREITANG
jgi:hypothetical protein